MKYEKVIWKSAIKQRFCPVSGAISDLSDLSDAQKEMEKYDCVLPYAEVSGSAPGEETARLIRKPFKMNLKSPPDSH